MKIPVRRVSQPRAAQLAALCALTSAAAAGCAYVGGWKAPGSGRTLRKVSGLRAESPYAVLGVEPGADKKEIRKRYRSLVALEHPDVRPDDPKAAERFAKLTAAYQELMDAQDSGFPAGQASSAEAADFFRKYGRGTYAKATRRESSIPKGPRPASFYRSKEEARGVAQPGAREFVRQYSQRATASASSRFARAYKAMEESAYDREQEYERQRSQRSWIADNPQSALRYYNMRREAREQPPDITNTVLLVLLMSVVGLTLMFNYK